jgi:23S rRNA (pseudouridine1915-N3)-methyltransferase
MSRELVVAWIGRTREPWETLVGDYRSRISHFVPIQDLVIRPSTIKSSKGRGKKQVRSKKSDSLASLGEDRARLRAEAEAIRSVLPDPSLTVALDRRGKQMDSIALAEWLSSTRRDWPQPIVFLLGSDLGLDAEIRNSARIRVSLGPLTLPHELARLVLYEQLYRALSIEAGSQYHRRPLD